MCAIWIVLERCRRVWRPLTIVLVSMLSALFIGTIPAQATSPMIYELVFRIDNIPPTGAQEAALDEAHEAQLDQIIADVGKANDAITVDGRCYCSGTARHRNEMSRRVAEAVTDYLVINGISDAAIATSWHDDEYYLAPAGDGSPTGQYVRVIIGVFDSAVP
jgi:hypothetical protein